MVVVLSFGVIILHYLTRFLTGSSFLSHLMFCFEFMQGGQVLFKGYLVLVSYEEMVVM